MSYSTIRDGLKTRLKTISGLRVYDTIPGDINPPAAVITPGDPAIVYDATQAGAQTLNFVVIVFASKASDRTAQDKLDGYLNPTGASSIKAAIEGDDTLGGTADSAAVTTITTYGLSDVAGVDYWTVRAVVEVLA